MKQIEFTAAWTGEQCKLTVDNLTDNEIACLLASRNNEYDDCMEGGTWSFSIAQNAHLNEKVYRGVVSSLIKKGYATVNGKRNDEVFALTKKGKQLFSDYVGDKL